MSNVAAILSREIRAYLHAPMSYIVVAVFLLLSGAFFVVYLAGTAYADTSIAGFLDAAQFLIPLFATIITMRLVAEERKQGTWELLMTAPLGEHHIVLGKFLGGLVLFAAMLALTLYLPAMLYLFGDPDIGPIATSYLGMLLFGAACLAIGTFASSVASNQLVAAVLSGGILIVLWMLGSAEAFMPAPVAGAAAYLSLSTHFPDFARGIVDSRAVVYYLSVTALFLYLATASIALDRWR